MSHLRFDGQGAGLNKRLGGNSNSPSDYTLICTCGKELGPLGGYFPNPSGHRTVLCLQCQNITIVDKNGQIAAFLKAPKEILEKAAKQTIISVKGA